jgi:hypothetical protein
MFKPLRAISAAFLVLCMLWPHSAVTADQPFQRFLPLLVDLAGWEGKKPDGMSMQMADTSMTTATRDYERGPAKIHASVIIGQAAEGALAPIQSGMKLQTPEGHMITDTMRGAGPEGLQQQGQVGHADRGAQQERHVQPGL